MATPTASAAAAALKSRAHLGAPVLLLLVATVQFVLTRTVHLTPWKGGGFGMFATIDSSASRRLLAEGIDAQGEPCVIFLAVPLYAGDNDPLIDANRQRNLLAMPGQTALQGMADFLLNSDLVPLATPRKNRALGRNERVYRLRRSSETTANPVRLRALRLSVWRLRFDGSEFRLGITPLVGPVSVGDWS